MVEGGEPAPETDPLRRAQRALRGAEADSGWEELCAMARLGRRLCTEQGRIAELYELMGQWHEAAEARDDRKAMEESARELVWILQGWGRSEEAHRIEVRRVTELTDQMTFSW
jgi:hypothetical protein